MQQNSYCHIINSRRIYLRYPKRCKVGSDHISFHRGLCWRGIFSLDGAGILNDRYRARSGSSCADYTDDIDSDSDYVGEGIFLITHSHIVQQETGHLSKISMACFLLGDKTPPNPNSKKKLSNIIVIGIYIIFIIGVRGT